MCKRKRAGIYGERTGNADRYRAGSFYRRVFAGDGSVTGK